ncbi:major facilitator superfamily domain-containing protein [Dipodascopsis uninucleata]
MKIEGVITEPVPLFDREGCKLDEEDDPERVTEKISTADIPNGGLKAWLQVAGSFVLFMNSWGISSSYGVFETYYTDINLSNRSQSDFAWVGSIQSFLLLIGGVITGPVFDKGHFKELLFAGTVFTTLGIMMLSLATEYWHVVLSQGVCAGIGGGCLFVPSVAILPSYFTTKRAFATGIAACGSSLGGLIFPIIFHKLQPRIGFGWSTRVLGFIVLGTQIFSIVFMRQRAKPSKTRALWDKTAFYDAPFMFYITSTFFTFAGVYVPFYYIQSFAMQKHIVSEDVAFYLIAIMNASSCFGRILPNFTADKLGPLNIVLPFAICTLICAFCWLAVNAAGGLIVFCISYGFFSGAFVSLPAPVMISITKNIDIIGTRIGMGFSITGIGLLIGTPIAGAILKTNASYNGAIYFGGATIATAVVFTILARHSIVGWHMFMWV